MHKDKRDKETITLGSGEIYMQEYKGDKIPDIETLFAAANLVGRTKGGAALTYSQETYEEKDDLGHVSKIITTSETATLKGGLLTWNGNTLAMLADRCNVAEAEGKRTAKIGGAGNAQGKNYAVGFLHEDKADGNVWVIIVGRNTAELVITFAADAGTVLEPEFTAIPHDEDGTLIEIIEEIPAAA